MIQPFTFQFCTAFRERKQLADKTNEIIEVINSADLENLPIEIERIDQNIANLNTYVSEVDANLTHRIDSEHDYVENWTIVTDESEIFETINGEKYFKHDTFIYYDRLGSRIFDYFIKGFPKKNVRIESSFINSTASENLSIVMNYLSVTNDDRFQIKNNTIVFNFDENPIKSQDDTEISYPEYGTAYNHMGNLIMSIRTR